MGARTLATPGPRARQGNTPVCGGDARTFQVGSGKTPPPRRPGSGRVMTRPSPTRLASGCDDRAARVRGGRFPQGHRRLPSLQLLGPVPADACHPGSIEGRLGHPRGLDRVGELEGTSQLRHVELVERCGCVSRSCERPHGTGDLSGLIGSHGGNYPLVLRHVSRPSRPPRTSWSVVPNCAESGTGRRENRRSGEVLRTPFERASSVDAADHFARRWPGRIWAFSGQTPIEPDPGRYGPEREIEAPPSTVDT